MKKIEMISRRLLELMTSGGATKVTIEFEDGNYYTQTLPSATEQYMEWSEKDGHKPFDYIAKYGTDLEGYYSD